MRVWSKFWGAGGRHGNAPGNRYYRGPPSDHFDGSRFFNPGGTEPRGLGALLRWQFGGNRARWPKAVPSPFPPARPAARVAGSALRISMIGHASMLIQTGGLNILTDPVWSERVSPFGFIGPKRFNPPGIRFADLPPIDAVLVSHNHYDHLDTETLARLQAAHDPLIVTPLGNDAVIRATVPAARVEARDWDGHADLGPGMRVHLVPVHHWSARWTGDRRMALWSGFVIESAAGGVFFAGDTGFDDGRPCRHLSERFPGLRLALLPIGAYEPRWFMAPQHQDPAEAVRGFMLSGAAFAAGIHWGTFQLTNENWQEPREELLQALDAEKIPRERFPALMPGQIWDVPEMVPSSQPQEGKAAWT